ncbi:MAG: hypothetical protein SPI71_02770 [Acidaminococcaceae bacterium]|nr:hypothetical protein [Acidaminococcaceae bacterium]
MSATTVLKNQPAMEQESLYTHLCRQRSEAAKIFPHCGENGHSFSRFVQGIKLSADSLKALKRV